MPIHASVESRGWPLSHFFSGGLPMKRIAISILLALSSVVSSFGADEKDLNGTWVVSESKQYGERWPDEVVKDFTLVFADGKCTASLGELLTGKGTYKVDRSKKPNTMD